MSAVLRGSRFRDTEKNAQPFEEVQQPHYAEDQTQKVMELAQIKGTPGTAQQQEETRNRRKQKNKAEQQHHPAVPILAAHGRQRTIPAPMSIDMGSRQEQEQERDDRMRHGPAMPEKGISDVSGGMQFEPRPDHPDEDRNQRPVDPKIEFAFVHFSLRFLSMQSNRLSDFGTMDKPGRLLDYPRYWRRKEEGLIPTTFVKRRVK